LKVKTGTIINAAALFYLMMPVIIFAFGWLKIGYACTVTAVLLAAFFFSRKEMADVDIHFDMKQVNIALAVGILVMLWVGLSGIGGISFQNSDHEVRNAIFCDLIQYS
jgi:hypothetical protein